MVESDCLHVVVGLKGRREIEESRKADRFLIWVNR